ELPRAPVFLGQLGIAEIEADAEFARGVEQRLRLGPGHLLLEERVHVLLLVEVPAREERGQGELWVHDEVAAVRGPLAKQRDEAVDDILAGIGEGDGTELGRADGDDSGHGRVFLVQACWQRSSRVASSTPAPATMSSGAVYSSGLWLMPLTLGTKIMAVGQMRAIICASWPAPEVIGRWLYPSRSAWAAMRAATPASKVTGSKRARRRVSMSTPSSRASASRYAASSASACCSRSSSVLRRSQVSTAREAMTLIRFGTRLMLPTVATWSPPISLASSRAKAAMAPAA